MCLDHAPDMERGRAIQQKGQRHIPARCDAEQTAAADCLQRPLRSRFRQRLSGSVSLLLSSRFAQNLNL
jgi:hypothetical protein